MPTLTFIEDNGVVHVVQARIGSSAMQAAVDASVPGITADCGGACACGTCHGYVEGAQAIGLPAPTDSERDMAECADDYRPNSRLTCQIAITDAVDGLVIRLPRMQA